MYKHNVIAFVSLVYAVKIRESKLGCVHLAVKTSIEVITVTIPSLFYDWPNSSFGGITDWKLLLYNYRLFCLFYSNVSFPHSLSFTTEAQFYSSNSCFTCIHSSILYLIHQYFLWSKLSSIELIGLVYVLWFWSPVGTSVTSFLNFQLGVF